MQTLAIIGFVFIVAILFVFSAAYALYFMDTMGQYTIGGSENTWGQRLFCLAIGFFIAVGWWKVLFMAFVFIKSV